MADDILEEKMRAVYAANKRAWGFSDEVLSDSILVYCEKYAGDPVRNNPLRLVYGIAKNKAMQAYALRMRNPIATEDEVAALEFVPDDPDQSDEVLDASKSAALRQAMHRVATDCSPEAALVLHAYLSTSHTGGSVKETAMRMGFTGTKQFYALLNKAFGAIGRFSGRPASQVKAALMMTRRGTATKPDAGPDI